MPFSFVIYFVYTLTTLSTVPDQNLFFGQVLQHIKRPHELVRRVSQTTDKNFNFLVLEFSLNLSPEIKSSPNLRWISYKFLVIQVSRYIFNISPNPLLQVIFDLLQIFLSFSMYD